MLVVRMTDKDLPKEMFDRAGVVFKEVGRGHNIQVTAGESTHNGGYPSCYTLFVFDDGGRLVRMGAWE